MTDRIRDARFLGYGMIVGLLLAAGVWAYTSLKPSLTSVISPPSKDLAKVDKETLNCIPVIVYKDNAKDKLGLPTAVVAASEQRVLGATQVNPNERPTTVSAVLNTITGEPTFYQRLDPLPWLAFNRKYEVGVSYIPLTNTNEGADKLIELDGRIQFIQIKALRAGLTGALDTDGGYKLGVRAWASF